MRGRTRIIRGAGGIATLVAAALGAYAVQSHRESQNATGPASGAVGVLELFTSEGCSSCPPADNVLARIIKDPRMQQPRVYALAFHVDSWNQATWSDPYSSPEYTRREELYNKMGVSDGIYTPQMVVNGSKVGVASDGAVIRSLIDDAMRLPASVALKLTAEPSAKEITTTVDSSKTPGGAILNIALVQREIVSHVPAGENAGRTLHHENVVRAYKSVELTQPHMTVKLAMPSDIVIADCSVIAYVQDAKLAVLGATDALLSEPTVRRPSAPAASQP